MPTKSLNGDSLTRALPSYYPKSDGNDLFWIIDAIGRQFDDTDTDIEAIDRAATVQLADTVAELEELAKLVQTRYRDTDGKESFRARMIGDFQLNTCEGTAEDVLTIASEALNTKPENLQYSVSTEAGVIEIVVPATSLKNLNMTIGDLSETVNNLVAAGHRVDLTKSGTLSYTDPATYNATADWTGYADGYDTVDTNGNPVGSGGTYSGLL